MKTEKELMELSLRELDKEFTASYKYFELVCAVFKIKKSRESAKHKE